MFVNRQLLPAARPAARAAGATHQLRGARVPGRVPAGVGGVLRQRGRVQPARRLRRRPRRAGLLREHDTTHGGRL